MIHVSTGAVPLLRAHFGAGIGSQHLSHVVCSGSETMLTSCNNNPNFHCNGHSRDAGVRCQLGLYVMQTFHNPAMSLNILLL